MFIVPLKDVIEISSEYDEFLINDNTNYIINFLFYVIEGGPKIYVCGIEREGPLGLKVKFLNKNGGTTRIKMYKLLDPHLLASNHNTPNPLVIIKGNNYDIPIEYSEITVPSRPIEETTDNYFYSYSFKVIDGSKQIHIASVKLDNIHSQYFVTIGFFNSGVENALISLNLLGINHLVGHDPTPAPSGGGTDLKISSTQNIKINSSEFYKVEIRPNKTTASVLSYTFIVTSQNNNVYVCSQYYDNQILNVEFYNESQQPASIEVSGWETFPYGT